MDVTPIGFVVIPLGWVLFVQGRRSLLYAYIFSIPFSAAAIINVPSITFGIQPSYYFMGLLIVRILLDVCLDSRIEFHGTPEARWGIVFLSVAVLSLVMPAYIDGNVWARGPGLLYHDVRLTITNFTQLGYLVFGILSYLVVRSQAKDETILLNSVRWHLFGGAFVSFWGIYQLFARIFHFPYPEVFNNSVSVSLGHFEGAGWGQYSGPKISSTTPEGVFFASYLASVFPLVVVLVLSSKEVRLPRVPLRLISVLTLSATLLNLATTTYIALVAFILGILVWGASPLTKVIRRAGRVRVVLILLIALIGAQLLWQALTGLNLLAFAWGTIYQKFSLEAASSGWYRWRYFSDAFYWFTQYPILGLGVGSIGTDDLLGVLLGNTGLLGFVSFSAFLLATFKRGLEATRLGTSAMFVVVAHGLSLAFFCLVTTIVIAAGALLFQQFWFLAATLSAASSIARERAGERITVDLTHGLEPRRLM